MSRYQVLEIRKGDTRPKIRMVCTRGGHPIDFSAAASVVMTGTMDGAPVFTDASPVKTALGTIEHTTTAGDTDTVGTILVKAVVTWSSGVIETFPTRGHLTVRIVP